MSEQTKIDLNVTSEIKELVIRHGEAAPAKQPRKAVRLEGTLGIVRERLSKLPQEVVNIFNEHGDTKLSNSLVKVNREKGTILLIEDAGMDDNNQFLGKLVVDPKFEEFGINQDKSYTTHQLADFIKMNRSFFETKDIAMNLVAVLRKFRGKVDKEIESEDNRRGDKRLLIAQVVESNIPESFKLDIPMFKNYPKQKIEVEIAIDPVDFSCKLVSPEAADLMQTTKNDLIDTELEEIRELFPSLAIFFG